MTSKNKQKKKRQIIKRTYKDSLFRMVFKAPENLLELYNAINQTHYEDPKALEINTLENAVYLSIKNDISVIVDTTLSLYEHQSTYSPNLPYRNLQYVAAIYAGMISENEIFRKRRMELTTVVLNINKGFNEQLMRTCQTLSEYTDLVARIRSYQKDMSFEEAATRAIDECISEGILEDFLRKNRREAIRVSVLECKVEDVIDILQKDAKEDGFAEGHANGLAVGHAEGLAKGLAEGLVEGKAEGKTQNQLSSIHAIMQNLNMNLTQAMDALNIPEQERKALIDQLNV